MTAPTHRAPLYLTCALLFLPIFGIGAPAIRSPAAEAPPALRPYQAQASISRARALQTASLAVGATPRILLVDDDTNDPDVRPFFTAALDGLGVAYDIWDTATSDEPDSATLANYAAVIWATGQNGYPDQAAEAALAAVLDHGHCLFVSSQEYFYNRGLTPTPFMQNYLGVASAVDDALETVVTGVGPVFGGIGPATLSLPPLYENYTDRISPDATATLAFSGDNGGPIDSGVQKDGGTYRTTYWGFGFEGLPSAAERQSAMQRVLSWCSFQTDLSLQQAVSPSAALRPGQPLTYTLSYKNDGVAIASGVLLTDTLPAALSGLSVSSSDPSNNSSQTAFEVVVPRLAFSSAAYNVAESGGTALLTVTLDTPNPFADTSVAYATSDGSAQAGSDYTAHSGTLIIPAGQASASFGVSIADDAAPEGGETVLLSLSNASGALLATPSSAPLTILSNDGIASPQITSALPMGAKRGVAYSHQFTASGLPQPSFTLAAGALPSGLVLSTDGMLAGMPTQVGSYTGISVTASNGLLPDATQTFSIVVSTTGAHMYLPLIIR